MNVLNKRSNHDILVRIVWSLGLMLIAIIIWVISGGIPIPWTPDWLSNVTSGLVVLALAGIWVSYFAEKVATERMRRDIDTRFLILSSSLNAKIYNIYHNESPSADNRVIDSYRTRLLSELQRTRGEVRILSIAAREFLHQGQGFAYDSFLRLTQEQPVKVLLLHPWSEQAVSRALREDQDHPTFEEYDKTKLYNDVCQSCATLVNRMNSCSKNIEARLYKVFPACFLVFVNDVVFVEQYHFGTGGRASGKVPIFEIGKGSKFYEQMEGHFTHVWEKAEPYQLSKNFIKTLWNPNSDERKNFLECLRFTRPDLFAQIQESTRNKEQLN